MVGHFYKLLIHLGLETQKDSQESIQLSIKEVGMTLDLVSQVIIVGKDMMMKISKQWKVFHPLFL